MKILILGGDGMLGHQLLRYLKTRHTVKTTLRYTESYYRAWDLFDSKNNYFNIDVLNTSALLNVLLEFRPDAVINAVGIIKQLAQAKESIPSIEINSLFPHRLSQLCMAIDAKMVHLSTDCVFSGNKGHYKEEDPADPVDLYGMSKYLGEVKDTHCITIRSSIIGLELSRKTSLIEWFLAQKNQIKGFRKAIYSGLTTLEMSRVIEKILTQHSHLFGIWHIASKPINKFDLLQVYSQKLAREDISIIPYDDFVCDRSLNSEKFERETNYQAPSWDDMLEELMEETNKKYGVLA